MNEAAELQLSVDCRVSPPKQGTGGTSQGVTSSKPIDSRSWPVPITPDRAVTRPLPQHSERNLYLLAGDLMSSPAITTRITETVSSVARLMQESGINGVPVLDLGGRPVGMVSDGDLLRHRSEVSHASWLELLIRQAPFESVAKDVLERPVSEVMSAPLITITPRASVREIAEMFLAHRIKRLPVMDGDDLVGVVCRTDLVRFVESLPGAPPVQSDDGKFLSFMESLIGGASLRGGLERPAASEESRQAEKEAETCDLSAEAFRDAVRARKAEFVDQREAIKQRAHLERQQKIKALLEQHVSDARWSEMLDKAKLAARRGEQEFLLLRFPSDLCSDGGRRINVVEAGWEGTLRGEAAELYSRWRSDLKPRGFGLSARVVSFEDGVIGDIALYLTWKVD